MSIGVLLAIAVALSMDALAVSVVNGISIKCLEVKHIFRIAFFFGGFQAVMPVLGWAVGLTFAEYFSGVAHWVAFGLLVAIGIKMILESGTLDRDSNNCLKFSVLLMLSLATSIDALSVGFSFAFLRVDIIMPSILIGAVTFIVCFIGVIIGNRLRRFLGKKFEIVGGVMLILIGIKILWEHIGNGL